MMLAGHVMVGGMFVALELTVTVNAQELVLFAASVATHVTFVAPNGKAEPEGGAQMALTPGQLSVAKGGGKATTRLFSPAAALRIMLEEQVIDGGWVSLTVTVKAH